MRLCMGTDSGITVQAASKQAGQTAKCTEKRCCWWKSQSVPAAQQQKTASSARWPRADEVSRPKVCCPDKL